MRINFKTGREQTYFKLVCFKFEFTVLQKKCLKINTILILNLNTITISCKT